MSSPKGRLPIDPQPYVLAFDATARLTADDNFWTGQTTVFDPRPGYEQTETYYERLDPRPYVNVLDSSRWPDDGGDPGLLMFSPRPEFSPDEFDYFEKQATA